MLFSKPQLALLVLPAVLAIERTNGVGRLPALGWNSWNAYHGDINETIILETAQKIIDLGLKDAGYEYVNMDDYWSDLSGRDSNGELVPDPTKFPDGIDGVASKIHALGLKVGIYSSASVETCGGYPASLGYEETDAATFAKWGIDYLKYDNCMDPSKNPQEHYDEYDFCTPSNGDDTFDGEPVVNGSCTVTNRTAPAGYDWTTSNSYGRYSNMSKAIMAQDHEILLSLCDWGWADVLSWGNETASSWRTVGDIQADWGTIMGTFNQAVFMSNSVDFWGHNDPDILEVGNGGIYPEECRTHFAMWAVMKSPLLIGTDLASLSADRVEILKNPYLLAFNQDPVYGKPATPFNWDYSYNRTYPSAAYWSGESSAGTIVLMFNPFDDSQNMTASWADVPGLDGGSSYNVTDIWTGTSSCVASGFERTVIRHDTAGALVGEAC